MEGVISGISYDTKTVKFRDEQHETTVPVMMTAFDGTGNEVLSESGWSGRHIIFHLIDGGVDEAFSDPHEIDHWAVGPVLTEFMLEVRRGWQAYGRAGIDWTEIPEDATVTMEDFEINEP